MRPPEIPLLEIQGETMGTYYIVKATETGLIKKEAEELKDRLDERLKELNTQMSTWQADSEISLFNSSKAGDPIPLSEDFAVVIKEAIAIAALTEGAFDPTVQPLLKLWGFGSEGTPGSKQPDASALANAKNESGIDKLIFENQTLSKTSNGLQLDLGAIAKGYAVDALHEVMVLAGQKNIFVDIGGEVRCSGVNPKGVAWRIGVQQPSTQSEYGEMNDLHSVISVKDCAVATSGNYRSYRQREDGSRYGHLLDPRISKPVESNVASVTVIANTCIRADALATGLFVMGAEKGLKLIETLDQVEALFLLWGENGELKAKASNGLANFLPKPE